jgi:general secretion pathway protein A
MTAQHREALSGLVYSVCERPGLTVLMGEAGTGKTTLLYVLRGWLDSQRYITAICTNPVLTREELFDLLLVQFQVNCSASLKNRQLTALHETLLRYRAQGRSAVLIVDEAQRLSTELLEDIRLLLNLETPQEKLLEIILIGQPELSEVLRRPELRQLKQRISCICRLEPLSLEELREYLQHRLALVGLARQTLFPEDTISMIFRYTGGIPRLVNSLCDGALQIGFGLRSPRITTKIVREAARDLDLKSHAPEAGPSSNGRVRSVAAATSSDHGPSSSPGVLPTLEDYTTRQKSLGFLSKLIGAHARRVGDEKAKPRHERLQTALAETRRSKPKTWDS